MSFILDAIKKSEEERQLKKGPTLHSVHQGKRANNQNDAQPSSRWITLGLAFVVIGGILWWMWPQLKADLAPLLQKRQVVNNTEHTASATQAAQTTTPASPTVAANYRDTAATEPHSAPTSLSAGSNVTDTDRDNESLQTTANIATEAAPAPKSHSGDMPPRNEIKDLWEMPADYQSSVPEMDYSFHVYASKPEQRAIIINGRRLKQGQSVQKGLVLKLITENGVVFHYKGRYFHVDVIEKW